MRLLTSKGYQLSDVASALQKAIRRGDARLAGYFAIEIFEKGGKSPGYPAYAWRRLLTVSAEDCAGIITQEIKALFDSWEVIVKAKGRGAGRIFLSKAVILLCQAAKSRDADHLTNLVYDPKAIDEMALEAALDEARATPEAIPDYAHDCHTGTGKRAGKTKTQFFIEEQDALSPRAPGFFDDDLEALRRGERKLVEKP